ncbi:spindle and kinetochore-associated protein 1-like [Asterias rubens]|uniref:spindle and kinetochore-associated protein 1-like n=1 Tax=Asterias rubens TaxID=7604 RepID=UPI0014551305|nr:spindle and kinetochore-associated protein 1-like [Asterias rubens]XP_033634536.1 spindle and kinetochore-associated protein 1-like [Asterias rubens]XP_033634537.1 spindle and kinetochore-associated protein 1-like [Asterias rubens]XP_033634538.1 spindle and kinetochore-associated protein 1-like [Asterias rubens]
MEATTLDELKQIFEAKIAGLTRCMDLSSEVLVPGGLDDSCRQQLSGINRELCVLESVVGQMRELIQYEKDQFQRTKTLKAHIEEMCRHVQHIETHIPDRLPGRENRTSNSNTTSNSRPPLKSVEDNQRPGSGSSGHQMGTKKDDKGHQGGKNKKICLPSMEFMTVDEFDAVPKYMKGRLTYESINAAVDLINTTVSTRYSLLQKPQKTLGKTAMKKVRQLKEQENKDTKGLFFFTDDDFKGSSNGRFLTTSRSIFTILRHCGRLREIRSTGLTRYALVP